MTTTKIVLSTVLACALCAAGIYAYAYLSAHKALPELPHAANPAAGLPASVADGTYTVQIHSILTAGDYSAITFSHVTYFDGKEASTSAAHDVACPKERPLAACVPTLTKGYYVRPSGAPEFSAALTPASRITLHDAASAPLDKLKSLNRQFDPVFDVAIAAGKVQTLTEKSPL